MTSELANKRALALIRIVVGFFFVVFGQYKVFGTAFTLGGGFQGALQHWLSAGNAYPFIRPMLRLTLDHFATPIALLVAYGELAIGLSLVFGVLSRVASIFGFILMIFIWFSAGYPPAGAAFWNYWAASLAWTMPALCFAALFLGRPEEVWSLAMVRKRQAAAH